MSICTFLASDWPLPSVAPSKPYPLEINLDDNTWFDGGADDNFFLHPFQNTYPYTEKPYGVWLEWRGTEGRANQLLQYIKKVLQHTDTIELWHVWLMEYYEFEDRPVIYQKTRSFSELTPIQILQIDQAEVWNRPDKQYPNRPSFYCLAITR